jgi:hypothetical protein
MKRIEWLLLGISVIIQPTHTSYFHNLKTLWTRASNALPSKRTCAITGGTSLLVGSGLYCAQRSMQEQDDSAALNYSINLMWINRNLQTDQLYIHPSTDEASFKENFLDNALRWGAVNNKGKVNLWYDGALISPEAVQNTKKMIAAQSLKHWRMAPIELKDVRELSDVQQHAEVFSAKMPVYFRVDLLRVCAAIHTVSIPQPTYFVYADIDMQPLSRQELFDAATLQKLRQYGIVMAHSAFSRFENGFQIISNQNSHLLQALKIAILELNINRGFYSLEVEEKFFNRPQESKMKQLQQCVYDSYTNMFKYLYHLEGLGTLTTHAGQKPYDYHEDGIAPFGVKVDRNGRHQHNLQFKAAGSEQLLDTYGDLIVPTKKVPLPPTSFNYD